MKNLLYILLIVLLSSCSTYYVNSQSPSNYTPVQEIVVQDYPIYPTITYVPTYSFTSFYSIDYYLPFYRYYFVNYNYYANSWNFNWNPYQFYGYNNYYNWYNLYPTYGYNNWNYHNHYHHHNHYNPFYQSANNYWKPAAQQNKSYESVKQTNYKTYSDNRPTREYKQPVKEQPKQNIRQYQQPDRQVQQRQEYQQPVREQPKQDVRQYQQPVRQQPRQEMRHSPQPSHKNNVNVKSNPNVKMGR